MIMSDGKNQYQNHHFSFWEWSAPVLQMPGEVIGKIHELKLVGRVVKDIIAVGMGYDWCADRIEDSVYNALEAMDPIQKEQVPNPDAFLPVGVELDCIAQIDQPLLIVFEDGDVLAVCFDEGSSARMELNTVPVTIQPSINSKNFHANRLFKDMIGKKIIAAEVTATTEYPDFTWSHGLELEKQPCYIERIDFIYTDESEHLPRRKLSFGAFFDYGMVLIADSGGRILRFPATDALWITEGYLEEKDI